MQETPEILLEKTSKLLDELTLVLQRNINALQHDSNSLLQEAECYEGLLQQIEQIKETIHDYLSPPEEVPQPEDDTQSDKQEDGLQQENMELISAGRQLRYPLAVTMPDGERICHRYGQDTFVEVIEKLGIKKVKSLHIQFGETPLIGTEYGYKSKECPGYYICVRNTTAKKAEILEEISERLNVRLLVDDRRERAVRKREIEMQQHRRLKE